VSLVCGVSWVPVLGFVLVVGWLGVVGVTTAYFRVSGRGRPVVTGVTYASSGSSASLTVSGSSVSAPYAVNVDTTFGTTLPDDGDRSVIVALASADGSPSESRRITLNPVSAQAGVVGLDLTVYDVSWDSRASLLDPVRSGFKAWNVPWCCSTEGQILATAALTYCAKVFLPGPMTVTNLHNYVVTAGATLTSGSCWGGLYSAAGAQLGLTATQHTAWASTGLTTMALTTPVAVSGEFVWVVVVATGTTLPTFATCTEIAVGNAGLTADDAHWATADGSITTTMPTTLGTMTASTLGFVVALS
jgi:hypothetical protein